ncbi:MAG: hypothetical protein L0214_01410 [candidate division NC10 bacterium]|nr:hypothetical protein [candidate division NC10 bacterium]
MEQRIGSLSRLTSDGRAFSVQTTILPEEAGAVTLATAEALAAGYFASLSRLSGGFLAVVRSPEAIALRLRGLRISFLIFAQAGEVPEPEGAAVGYAITGGLLLRGGAQGGRLIFRAARAGAGLRATVDLEGFSPAVLALPGGGALYRVAQAPLIAWAGRKFLSALRRRPERLQQTGPVP